MLRACILLLITTLLPVAAAWWYMNETAVNEAESERQDKVEEGFLTTRKDFNDKMEDFKRRKNELLVQIERFEIRKKKASQQLKEMGIKTAADLDGNDDARRKFNSIRQDQADIAKLNEDIVLFDEAISAIESGLRELERKDYWRMSVSTTRPTASYARSLRIWTIDYRSQNRLWTSWKPKAFWTTSWVPTIPIETVYCKLRTGDSKDELFINNK